MSKSDYHHVDDGEWIQIEGRSLRHACCDCGLVHDMRFRIRKGKIEFKVSRHPQATSGMRRSYKFKKADVR